MNCTESPLLPKGNSLHKWCFTAAGPLGLHSLHFQDLSVQHNSRQSSVKFSSCQHTTQPTSIVAYRQLEWTVHKWRLSHSSWTTTHCIFQSKLQIMMLTQLERIYIVGEAKHKRRYTISIHSQHTHTWTTQTVEDKKDSMTLSNHMQVAGRED